MADFTLDGISERLLCLERLVEEKTRTSDMAIEKATDTMNLRLEGMNEFREQLNKQTKTFMTRAEVELKIDALEEKCTSIDKRIQGVEMIKADITGRIWTLGVVMTILVIALEFIGHFVLKSNFPLK